MSSGLATIGDKCSGHPAGADRPRLGFGTAVRLNLHEGICNHFSVMLAGRCLINPKGLALRAHDRAPAAGDR